MAKKVVSLKKPFFTADDCEALKKEAEGLRGSSEINLLKPLHKKLEDAIRGITSSPGSLVAFNHLANQLKLCKLVIKRRIELLLV